MIRSITGLCVTLALLLTAYSANAAVYTVTKIADTNDGACDADCSLREAVAAANATTDNDTIVFAHPLFSTPRAITLSGTEIVIMNNGSLAIYGTGASRLTISGNGASRIMVTSAGVVGSLSSVRLTGGNGVGAANTGRGGAFYNNGGNFTLSNVVISGNTAANGGALNNAGTATLTIINSVISGNTSSGAGGGMQNFSGNTMNILNSTIAGNTSSSTLTGGGAIQANGTLNISNTTFSGNTAAGGDGGALYYNGQSLIMTNTTIAGNTATGGGSGGLHKSTSTLNANVRNTIIAGNTGGTSPDAIGAFTSQGNNIVQAVGTSTGWVGSDLQNVDPLLGPLGFYGGIVMTRVLLFGSPAIDAGQNCVTNLSCSAANPPLAITTDARYFTRSSVDIGAYEVSVARPAGLPNAGLNQAYSFTIASSTTGFTYATTGDIPPGLTLSNAGGQAVLSGVPTAAGTYVWTIGVSSDAAPSQSRSQLYMLTVSSDPNNAVLTIRYTDLPLGTTFVRLADQQGNLQGSVVSQFGYAQFSQLPVGGVYTANGFNRTIGSLPPVTVSILGSYIVEVDLSPTRDERGKDDHRK